MTASGVYHDDDPAEPAVLSSGPIAPDGSHAFLSADGNSPESHASTTEDGHAAERGASFIAQDRMTSKPEEPIGLPTHEPAVSAGAAAPAERVVGFTKPAPSQAHASPQKHALPAHAAAASAAPSEGMAEGIEQESRHAHPNFNQDLSSRPMDEPQPAHPQHLSANVATPDLEDRELVTKGAAAAVRERQPQDALPGLDSSADGPNTIRPHPYENGAVQQHASRSSGHATVHMRADAPRHALVGSEASPAAAAKGEPGKVADKTADGTPATL